MFYPHTHDSGALQPWDYLPVRSVEVQTGMVLLNANGRYVPLSAASTEKPEYICMATRKAEEGELVPVLRVRDDMIYETRLTAEAAGAGVGTKLQVSKGGLGVDGGAEGSFEVTYIEGTAAGSVVRGRFV